MKREISILKPAYIWLVEEAQKDGWSIDIFDGEEDHTTYGATHALEYIHSVEDAYINLHKPDIEGDKYQCWARVIWGWDMTPEETIADYSIGGDSDDEDSPHNYIDRAMSKYNALADQFRELAPDLP